MSRAAAPRLSRRFDSCIRGDPSRADARLDHHDPLAYLQLAAEPRVLRTAVQNPPMARTSQGGGIPNAWYTDDAGYLVRDRLADRNAQGTGFRRHRVAELPGVIEPMSAFVRPGHKGFIVHRHELDSVTMRILHVIPSLAARDGGPAKAAIEMCREITRRGAETEIFTTNLDGRGVLDV